MTSAFVVGATGAVGSELVKLLGEGKEFSKVVIWARRNIDSVANEKFEQKIVDFDKLEENQMDLKEIDVGFCALGTTRGKSGADGFYKVDHDYVVNTAKIAKENGVKQFVLISAKGSNEKSFFLYPKTKGQVEREIGELGFEKYVILQPGLIEAEREETRIGEKVLGVLVKPLKLLTNSLASSSTDIAKAMIQAVRSEENGKHIWDNSRILEEAKKFEKTN